MTDSPEVLAARAEGWADKKAQWRPMTLAARSIGGWDLVKETAGKYGKVVIGNLERAGISDEEVQAARKRMLAWLKIVETHHAAVRDVRDDRKIPKHERKMLIMDMYAQEDQERVRLFGE